MSWRDRAIAVDDSTGSAGGWRSRAVPDLQGPPSDKPGAGEAFATGASQGATLGFGDEIMAAMDATGFNDPKRGNFSVPGAIADVAGQISRGENPIDKYRATRDFIRNRMAQGHEAHPWAFNAGNIAGSVATAPIIPAVAGWGGAAKTGATLGAIQGLGGSNADLTQGDVGGAAKDTAVGGGLGAATGVAAKAGTDVLGKVVDYLSGKLAGTADDAAQYFGKHAIGATKRFLNTPQKVESMDNAVRTLRENNVITPMASATDMLERTEAINSKVGNEIGEFLGSQGSSLDSDAMIGALETAQKRSANGKLLAGGVYDDANAAVKKGIDSITAHESDPISFSEATNIKNSLRRGVNYQAPKETQDLQRGVAAKFREELDRQLQDVSGNGQEFQDFLGNKKVYGDTNTALDPLQNLYSMSGNKPFGLTDTVAATGGLGASLITKDPMTALYTGAGILAKKGMEKYGAQTATWTSDVVKNVLEKTPEVFGKFAPALTAAAARGANALATTQFILAKREPEFQEIMKKIGGNQDEH